MHHTSNIYIPYHPSACIEAHTLDDQRIVYHKTDRHTLHFYLRNVSTIAGYYPNIPQTNLEIYPGFFHITCTYIFIYMCYAFYPKIYHGQLPYCQTRSSLEDLNVEIIFLTS